MRVEESVTGSDEIAKTMAQMGDKLNEVKGLRYFDVRVEELRRQSKMGRAR